MLGSSPQHYTIFLLSIHSRICFMRLCPSPGKAKRTTGPRHALMELKDTALKLMQEEKLLSLTQRTLHRQCWRTMTTYFTYFYFANLNPLLSMTIEEKPWREKRKHTLSSCESKQTCPPACREGYNYLMTSFRPEWTRLN